MWKKLSVVWWTPIKVIKKSMILTDSWNWTMLGRIHNNIGYEITEMDIDNIDHAT